MSAPSPWKHNPDGSLMGDEEGYAVTEASYEMQRPVAARVWKEYQQTGSWFSASLPFGCGPEWGKAITRRYGFHQEP